MPEKKSPISEQLSQLSNRALRLVRNVRNLLTAPRSRETEVKNTENVAPIEAIDQLVNRIHENPQYLAHLDQYHRHLSSYHLFELLHPDNVIPASPKLLEQMRFEQRKFLLRLLFLLREQPFSDAPEKRILCSDLYTDAEVVDQYSSPEDKESALWQTVEEQLHPIEISSSHEDWTSDDNKDRDITDLNLLIISTIFHYLLFISPHAEEVVEQIMRRVETKTGVKINIDEVHLEAVSQLLKGYVQTMSHPPFIDPVDSTRDSRSVIREQQTTITIDGVPGQIGDGYRLLLDETGSEQIQPLIDAVHYGRKEMVRQALIFARQLMPTENLNLLENKRPPSYWITEQYVPLRSDELLMYLPPSGNDDESQASIDAFFAQAEKVPLARFFEILRKTLGNGWYVVKISKQFPYIAEGYVKLYS